MSLSRVARYAVMSVAVVTAFVLGVGHIVFGLGNFRPGFPKGEGVASLVAGAALLASLIVARRSIYNALLTAWLGTLPLVAWFAYAVPLERSSDPVFLWMSLIVPTIAGAGALIARQRRSSGARR